MRHSALFLSLGIALEVISVTLTVGSAMVLETLNRHEKQTEFEGKVDLAVASAAGRIAQYETALRAATGLYDASKSVERVEWKAFIQALNIGHQLQGCTGFGHVSRVRPGEMEEFLKREREDDYPAFKVIAGGNLAEEQYIVNAIEPVDLNLPAIGFTISSEQRRREAAFEAMRTGKTRITRIISLVQESQKKPGFLMLTPHYSTRSIPATEEERLATCIGWTGAPFIGDAILKDLLSVAPDGLVFSIYEETIRPEQLIAQAEDGEGAIGNRTTHREISIGGRPWIFVAHSTEATPSTNFTPTTWVTLVAGLATSSGLLVVLLLLHRASNRALAKATSATTEARLAGEAKSRFLAVMSHEIRTPLNGVIGMAELALHEEMPPAVHVQLSTIQNCGRTLLSLVNDILDYSRFETGNIPLENSPFDATCEIENAVKLLRTTAAARGLLLKITAPASAWVLGDALRFRQILLNLTGNAVKFTSTGEVEILLESHFSGLTLTIRDTGIGMDAEGLSRLFNPFSQADASTSRRFGGTGLGLAITKQLVEGMQGQITVESHVGVGSIFRVTLPLQTVPAQPLPAPILATTVHLGLHVLLAEDGDINQIIASGMLRKLGCTVTPALNGLEAIEKAPGHDLILMDCNMPEMDGLEATRRLRAAGCVTPIIALTANASLEDRDACIEAGMNDFLSKPIEKATLARALSPYAKQAPPVSAADA